MEGRYRSLNGFCKFGEEVCSWSPPQLFNPRRFFAYNKRYINNYGGTVKYGTGNHGKK